MKNTLKKIEAGFGKAAYEVTKSNVNSACWWCIYQPELPKAAKKLRK